MSGYEDQDEGSDEDEKDVEENLGHDHVIFLIDSRETMREHLLHCLEVALHVTKAKIIASNKSNIAVIFFGTKMKNTDVDGAPDNIFTLFTLDSPSASRIKILSVCAAYFWKNLFIFVMNTLLCRG
jgi:hypothetical protein